MLLVQATSSQVPLVWAKGIMGLSVMWCLLHDLQGTDPTFVLEARGRHGLPPLGAYEWAPPVTPVTSGVPKKEKKRALQPSVKRCCSHSPGNIPIMQLPLPNAMGDPQTLGHCPFSRSYN